MNRILLYIFLFTCINAYTQADLQNTKSIVDIESKEKVDNKPKMTFKTGGRIKLLTIYDFQGLQGNESFDIFKIPVGEENVKQARFFAGAEQSRLKFDIIYNTKNIKNIRAYIEGDFSSSGYNFRLRHAYLRVNHFLFGQYWSNFVDEESFPTVVDIDGPATSVFIRTPQIRYTKLLKNDLEISASIEYTTRLLETNSLGTEIPVDAAYQSLPDFLTKIKFREKWGHMQLSGVVRSINYKSGQSSQNSTGYGAVATLKKVFNQNNNLIAQFTAGKGIARYLNGFNFGNTDAAADKNGKLKPIPAYGGSISYQLFFSEPRLFSTFVYGYAALTNNVNPPPYRSKIVEGNYYSVNLGYRILPDIQFVIEALYGNRTNEFGEKGAAKRIQFMTQFNF